MKMSSHDHLLTNTTNRLGASDEEKPFATPVCNKQILVPTPIHQLQELPFFAKRQHFLNQQIAEAQQQQLKMLEMFESIGRLERGEVKSTKKLQRRCNKDILQKLSCPQANCNRFYSTEDTLNRHIKLKHKIVKHSPPEPYVDLSPWPNLNEDSESKDPPDKIAEHAANLIKSSTIIL